MTIREAACPAQAQAKRLQFDRYVLDLDRGCLLLEGAEIALRPKTFAILRHLVENSGRLVSKEELFAAVWPNLAITVDVLVQSIGELRRALGGDGPRVIKTIPRRGYRFESPVSVIAAGTDFAAKTASGLAVSNLGAFSPTPPASSRRTLASWRGRLFASMALVILLGTGVMWTGIGSKLHEILYFGHQFTKDAAIGDKATVAVLPFLNLGGTREREYFADGLTQDIINSLGRFSGLTVMSWNAVFPYKSKPARPAEIARGLAVRYQVEGSVQQTGDQLRVIAQLVDADGRVLWSARYDEALADLFSLQEEIATRIARALPIHVTESEQRRVFAKPTQNLEAYDYVLRARPALERPTRANNVEARTLLRHAIELDPHYAAAYAALAEADVVDVTMGWAESPMERLDRAEGLADKALGLDDSEVRAHVVLGRIAILYHRYDEAKRQIDRAIAINPNDASGLAGRGNILMWLGQTDAAIEALELAQRIDPELGPIDRNALGLAYYLKQRYDAAIDEAELNLGKTKSAPFSYVTLAAAAAGPTSLAAEVSGKAWLFTLGQKDGATPGANEVAEIGPVPPITAPEYLLRINHASGPPGAKTSTHSHPGSEAFYVLAGRLGQKTPEGIHYAKAGEAMNGHGPGTAMEVFSAGTSDLDQLVMFLVDATKPFSVPAKLE